MEFIVDEFEDKNKQFEAKKALRKQYIKLLKTVKNPSKNAWNPFTKSKYADLSSVLDVIKEAQNKTDLAFFQDVSSDDGVITCYSYLIGMDGEIRFEPLTMPVKKTDPQSYASIETYARRYSAQSCTGIVAEADDDGNQSSYQHNNNQSNRSYGNRNYGNNSRSYSNNNYQSNRGSSYKGRNNYQGNQSSGSNNGSNQSSPATKKQFQTMGELANKINEITGDDAKAIGNKAIQQAGITDKHTITHQQGDKVCTLLINRLKEVSKAS